MFATDFLFDSHHASDFGLMICSFDRDMETASGGEIEYNTIKTPNRDKFTFYGTQFNSVIEWNFAICKKPGKNVNPYFSQYEESMIAKWLLKTDGYKLLQFAQEGREDIFYNVCFQMTPYQIAGQTVGFYLTAASDCAYGFTDVIKRKATNISSSAPLILNVHSDINTYILPLVKITGEGNLHLSNTSDKMQNITSNKATEFKNMPQEEKWEFILDSDTDTIFSVDSDTGTISALTNPDVFNWYFLRLTDGKNIITTNSESDIKIELQYREPRRVIV